MLSEEASKLTIEDAWGATTVFHTDPSNEDAVEGAGKAGEVRQSRPKTVQVFPATFSVCRILLPFR